MNVLIIAASICFSIFAFKVLLISIEITDARKKAYREGTHDYYGNKL
tara:strand:- start:4485 stop:4625 length:141 start_codon:yes stop_codon:yes gene_type:complete